jgi:hypothetical protein
MPVVPNPKNQMDYRIRLRSYETTIRINLLPIHIVGSSGKLFSLTSQPAPDAIAQYEEIPVVHLSNVEVS